MDIEKYSIVIFKDFWGNRVGVVTDVPENDDLLVVRVNQEDKVINRLQVVSIVSV